MGMNEKHFNGFIGLILGNILDVFVKLPESPEKEKLQKLADNLQKMIED